MDDINTTQKQSTKAKVLYDARLKRFNDAVSLKRPDRIPIASFASFFMTQYSGISNTEAMYDYEKMAEAWKNSLIKLNWDMVPLTHSILPGPVMDILGLKTYKWPGRHLEQNLPFQFIEREYMKADEYDELLTSPDSFIVRKLMPRMVTALEALGNLPPLTQMSSGITIMFGLGNLAGLPAISQMLETALRLGKEMKKWITFQRRLLEDLAKEGFPNLGMAVTKVTFDWISDDLRGMRGSMLDMYRQPGKLKALIERYTPLRIGWAIESAKRTGSSTVFIPLHRGAAGFMSDEQFAQFYWPSLKQLCLALIAAGLTPMPFFEGDYTPRLKYLAELPPGKVAGHFDIVDKKKAKETIGDNMCFWGNLPASLLVTGKPDRVKDYVKELIDTFGDNGGLIVDGSVDGVPPEAKPENVEAMTETVFEYGVY